MKQLFRIIKRLTIDTTKVIHKINRRSILEAVFFNLTVIVLILKTESINRGMVQNQDYKMPT
jgi:hypothetical protein